MNRWLIALDMDSTFIQQEVIDLLAAQAGVESEVAAITERAMNGELDFRQSLELRVSKLAGLTQDDIDAVAAQITLSPGAQELVESAHEAGHVVAIYSGGFLNVIEPLLQNLGIDYYTANTLELNDGALTGKTIGSIVDAQAKAEHLQRCAQKFSIPMDRTIAVGDGANDIPMMQIAGVSIAYNGKPKAVAVAQHYLTNQSLLSVLDYITD